MKDYKPSKWPFYLMIPFALVFFSLHYIIPDSMQKNDPQWIKYLGWALGVFFIFSAFSAYDDEKKKIHKEQINDLIENKAWQEAVKSCPSYIPVDAQIFLKQNYTITKNTTANPPTAPLQTPV